ncbi:fimbrial protein [Stenotrophomonas maltophilia]|uniref:fimbrial protein n=1 Tax=Stenotrophomonas maltophilia TaxID=40324 RepID=UPI001FA75FD0|nr:fimbrial protein [Stenotrophomonas maltophilia]
MSLQKHDLRSNAAGWKCGAARALASIIGLGASVTAAASCVATEAGKAGAQFDVPHVEITANGTPNGRAVSPWLASHIVWIGYCTYGASTSMTPSLPEITTFSSGRDVYSVYDVGVPGLGIIVGWRDQLDTNREFRPLRTGTASDISSGPASVPGYTYSRPEVRVRYVKVGDLAEGAYSTASIGLGQALVRDSVPGPMVGMGIAATTVGLVHRPVCYPQPTTVRMGSVPKTDFKGQFTGSRKRRFSITLDCDAGVGDVQYYLEATAASPAVSSERGIVAVSGGAGGVGLQMLHDGDADMPVALEAVQSFGSTAGGRISRSFEARYVQTAAKADDILPGTANASIRIVMNYP